MFTCRDWYGRNKEEAKITDFLGLYEMQELYEVFIKRGILDETHSYLSGGMKQLLYIVLNVVH